MVPEWLAWLDAHAGFVQAVSTLVLVAITGYYAVVTARMAGATRQMVQQARRQHLEAALPVVVFGLAEVPESGSFPNLAVEVSNEGAGPALDLEIRLVNSPPEYGLGLARTDHPQPLALAAGRLLSVQLYARGSPMKTVYAALVRNEMGKSIPEGTVVLTGTLQASYRDIYGRVLGSEAPIEQADDVEGLRLGRTSLSRPSDP